MESNSPASQQSGLTRAALLMMSLGEDAAAEVFKYLTAREVQLLGSAMASLKQVTRDDVSAALEEFRQEADQFMAVSLGSDEYIRSVLTKALGSDRAASLIEDILEASEGSSGIDALNWLDANTVAELIGDEHPQIIATILVHLERDRAAAVLALLGERLRNDVMLRIATFGGVQPTALAELTETLNSVLAGQGAKRSKMGGVRTAAEILNMMNSSDEEAVISSLRERDAELAQRIVDEMFVFENLMDVEDRGIQLLLKEVDHDTLMVALKGVPDELRDKFLRNMSSRAAEILREDLEAQGPVRMSKVEAEQKKILQIARRLAESGQIVLGNQGDDAYV
jgi:flagellar motor switch protein FliG